MQTKRNCQKGIVPCFFWIFLIVFSLCGYASVQRSDIPRIDPARASQRIEKSIIKARTLTTKPLIKEEKAKPKKKSKVKFMLKKIVITGASSFRPAQFKPLYQSVLNHEINLQGLQKIANAVTHKYRRAGYILSRALVPAQSIHQGVARIHVIEGYISDVTIRGDISDWIYAKLDSYAGHILDCKPLRMRVLERYVLLANDLPGVQVKTVLAPSKTKPGATHLTFVVKQTRFSFSASYNNHGTRYLGPLQATATPQADNVLWGSDRLGVRVVDTVTNDDMRFAQIFYQRALGSYGLLFDGSAGYTRTRPGFTLEALHLKGESKSWMVGLSYPLLRSRRMNFYVNTSFKWLDTKTDYTSTVLYQDHIRSLRLGATFNAIDRLQGVDTMGAKISRGLRVFGASKHDPKYPLSRTGGRSDYTKVDANISRLQALKYHLSTYMAAYGQYTWKPLLSAEEFGVGGSNVGRGYNGSEIIGDNGASLKTELRWDRNPNWFLFRHVQYYIFYDAGFVVNTGDDNDQPDRDSLMSTGLGMRITFAKHFSGNFELAKPMTRQVQTQADSNHYPTGWRGFFNLSAVF